MLKINKTDDWLEQASVLYPNKTAFIFKDESYTFRQCLEKVTQTEFHLGSIKIGKGDLAAVVSQNNPEFIFLVFALWRTGAVPVLLNPKLSTNEITDLIDQINPKCFFIHEQEKRLYDSVSFGRKIIFPFLSGNYKCKGNPLEGIDRSDEAIILFTSGSTDKPKGVVLTFANLFESAAVVDSIVKHDENDLWMASLPFYHIGGFSIIVRALLSGNPVIIPKNLKTETLIRDYSKYEPTLFSLVQAQLKEFINLNFLPNKNLKSVFLGGGPSDKKMVKRAIQNGWNIIKVYGSTETASMIAALKLNESRNKLDSSGRALPNCKIDVIADEIVIAGPTVFKNYFNDENYTNAKLREGKYFTGDTGYIDDDGFLFVTGRKDDMIISGGENINPTETKDLLEAHPAIKEAFVFGIQDEKWNSAITAAVSLHEKIIGEDEIKLWLKEKTASYKIPKKIFFIDELPKTELGKIDKQKLFAVLEIN